MELANLDNLIIKMTYAKRSKIKEIKAGKGPER